MEPVNRPPLGIMPKYIWEEKRFEELKCAISRYFYQGYKIPIEWIEEYNDYMENNYSKTSNRNFISVNSGEDVDAIIKRITDELEEHIAKQ